MRRASRLCRIRTAIAAGRTSTDTLQRLSVKNVPDDLADLLVEEGLLAEADRTVAVDRCVARLRDHFGRVVES